MIFSSATSSGTPDLNTIDCIKTFHELGSPFIADGMQVLAMPRRIADPALRPLIPGKRVAGTVVTLRLDYYPTESEPHPYVFDTAFTQAGQVPSPVLVTESRLGLRSPFGGGASRSFVHAGLTGVVIDGCIRDTADVTAQGMQMFHRQISTDSFLGRVPEGYVGAETAIDVDIGGVRVTPGDLVIADEDGIVFCSTTDAPAVIEAARDIETEEEQIFARWQSGEGYLKGLGLSGRGGGE